MAKTCPSCGYHEADNQALYCNKCGYPFPQNQPGKPAVAAASGSRPAAPRAVKRPVHRKAGGRGFLSFGTLITENYLNLIYLLGAVIIVLMSVMGIAGMFAKKGATGTNISIINTTAIAQDPASSPLFWIGFLVIGSVFWRMFCELFVVLSRAHGTSLDYRGETEPEEETAEYEETGVAADGPERPPQYIECPKCRRLVTVGELRECEHCGVQGCVNCIRLMGLLKKSMTCRECFEAK